MGSIGSAPRSFLCPPCPSQPLPGAGAELEKVLLAPRAAAKSSRNAWVLCLGGLGVSKEIWWALTTSNLFHPRGNHISSKSDGNQKLSPTSPPHPRGPHAPPNPTSTGLGPLGSLAPSLTLGMRLCAPQHRVVWMRGVHRSHPLASILGCLGEGNLLGRSESPRWGGQPHPGGEGRAWFRCKVPLGLETWLPSRPRELGTRRRVVGKARRWVQVGARDAFLASMARARPASLRHQQGITHLKREARSLHHPRRGKPAVFSVWSLPVRLLRGGGRWPWVRVGAPSSHRGTQTLLPEVTLRMPTLLTPSLRTQTSNIHYRTDAIP
ncbi:uncharacterized protein LOC118178138 isoform X1 [Oxyura jamaicensis]|uniref:uncharacterized protein LOC118178138 isoform X1 n=1 Tax=Oxyura jamaicensis TaxID=8884 RepID=UPI0015A70C6C|nr:uncharacterized protein LOC118178138 isoform X1 [Oxyura jamaicensis]